jgi:GGDEF domain-containing protein
MISVVYRKFAGFALPALILAAAGLGLHHLAGLPSKYREFLPYLPILTITIGIFLSFHFRRGRVFLVLLILAALHWSLHTWLAEGGPASPAHLIFQFIALLFPMNITLVCFMRERGALTTAGRMRFGFLAIQAGVILWLVRSHGSGVAEFFKMEIIHTSLPSGISLSQPALLMLAISFPIAATRLVMRPSPVNSALIGAMVAMAAVCSWPMAPNLPILFVAAAALALTLGVLQDSHDMAFRDDLTGLPSRRALNERLTDLGRRYVIAMLDVDYFKNFNDTYGHDVGDQVLKMVARKIQGVKGGGKPYRYGGEEFIVIFPRCRLDEAVPYLEDVRKAIAAYQLVIRDNSRPLKGGEGKKHRYTSENEPGETASVTISIGVAESDDHSTPADVLKEADQALYRAKRKGRDILSR